MSEQRLNEHVKGHYTETLRPEKLAQLLAQADTTQLKNNRWVALRKSWMIRRRGADRRRRSANALADSVERGLERARRTRDRTQSQKTTRG